MDSREYWNLLKHNHKLQAGAGLIALAGALEVAGLVVNDPSLIYLGGIADIGGALITLVEVSDIIDGPPNDRF